MIFSLFNAVSANNIGTWDRVGSSGCACVHFIQLPNNRALCMERPHLAPYPPNPNTGGLLVTEISLMDRVNADGTWNSKFTVNDLTDSPFCGGHSQLPDGSILVVGGDNGLWLLSNGTRIDTDGHPKRRIYTPCTGAGCTAGSFSEQPDMTTGRWYPSVTTLFDGT